MENKIGHLHINAPLGPIWSTIFQLFWEGRGGEGRGQTGTTS